MKIDTLIKARYIIPILPRHTVLEHHALAIHDGKIKALLPTKDALVQFQPREIIDRSNHMVLPGFINAHNHLAMNLLRGIADDLTLSDWLNNHLWPAEAKWVSPEFVYDGSLLGMAEMIKSGTTCFNDHYFFPDQVFNAAEKIGLRGTVGLTIIGFPTAWAKTDEEYLTKARELLQSRHSPLLKFSIAPHAIYSVAKETLQRCKALAQEFDLRIHIHVQETALEVTQCLDKWGARPMRCLADWGLVDDHLIAVHMTQVNDEDKQILKQAKAHVVHCPQSNMKLASGACPVQDLINTGINVALGTDSVASNNDLNMFGEIRSAALLAKLITRDPTAVSTWDALEMATLGGAKALGIEDTVGSITPGKAADFITINTHDISLLPIYHPTSQIVYSAQPEQVHDVFVNGRALMRERQLLTVDENTLKATALKWENRIRAR